MRIAKASKAGLGNRPVTGKLPSAWLWLETSKLPWSFNDGLPSLPTKPQVKTKSASVKTERIHCASPERPSIADSLRIVRLAASCSKSARLQISEGKHIWLWVNNFWYHKWNPVKWKEALKPAVPWWFNFDPYPYWSQGMMCFPVLVKQIGGFWIGSQKKPSGSSTTRECNGLWKERLFKRTGKNCVQLHAKEAPFGIGKTATKHTSHVRPGNCLQLFVVPINSLSKCRNLLSQHPHPPPPTDLHFRAAPTCRSFPGGWIGPRTKKSKICIFVPPALPSLQIAPSKARGIGACRGSLPMPT